MNNSINYPMLANEDEDKLRELHKRCYEFVNKTITNKATIARKDLFCNSDVRTKAQLAWDLYCICRGLTYRTYENHHAKFNELKIPFNSLSELDLKLSILGY